MMLFNIDYQRTRTEMKVPGLQLGKKKYVYINSLVTNGRKDQ